MGFQQTEEWFEQRKGRITGSRVGAILGLSPFATADDVLREMVREHHGAEKEFTGNVATEWGNQNENTAISALEDHTGELVISTGFHVHPDFDWLGASPDGFIGDGGMVEIKCPFGLRKEENPEFKTLREQPHYMAQVQLAMQCTGKTYCDFFQWAPNGQRFQSHPRDDVWFEKVLPELQAFHQKYLETIASEELSAPHLAPLEVERTDEDWHGAVAAFQLASETAKKYADLEKQAKQRLIELANGKKTRGCGALVYPSERSGSIAYAKAVKELLPGADLEKYRGKSSTSWAVKIS